MWINKEQWQTHILFSAKIDRSSTLSKDIQDIFSKYPNIHKLVVNVWKFDICCYCQREKSLIDGIWANSTNVLHLQRFSIILFPKKHFKVNLLFNQTKTHPFLSNTAKNGKYLITAIWVPSEHRSYLWMTFHNFVPWNPSNSLTIQSNELLLYDLKSSP